MRNLTPIGGSRIVISQNRNGAAVGSMPADNKFVSETLNIQISPNAPPIYIPALAMPYEDEFKLSNSSYSLKQVPNYHPKEYSYISLKDVSPIRSTGYSSYS